MKIRMKSQEEIKQMLKDGTLSVIGGSDDGTITQYLIKNGAFSTVYSIYYDEYGQEFDVIDDEHIITKQSYDAVKSLFKE